MSKVEKENTESKEKVVTKYDLKVKRREQQKAQAKKEKARDTIFGILIVAAVFAFVAYFPIKSYLSVNGTYIKVGNESVSKVEFDYHYNIAKTNYISQYSYYLSMFGVDLSGDLSTQMYSDTLTWKDFFEQLTVEEIAKTKALKAQAESEGFTYDVEEDYQEYLTALKDAYTEAGSSEREYVASCYGSLATVKRIESFVKEGFYTGAFYDKVSDEKAPSDQEIADYYAENKNTYDSVDYRVTTVNAELPTEPTDLADPVEEKEGTEGEDTTEDEAYVPSDAEVEFAMKVARAKAEAAEDVIATEGELRENTKSSSLNTDMKNWLFDEARQKNETTIIENTSSNCYYVLQFVNRYLDESPSVNARIIITDNEKGEALLNEWKNGAATQESFGELADANKSKDSAAGDGGLFENLLPSDVPSSMKDWLFDSARKEGDAEYFAAESEDSNAYVVYYVAASDPEWKLDITQTLLNNTMTEYLTEISRDYEVKDSKKNLNYIQVEESVAASESAAKESEAQASESGDAEASDNEETTEGADTSDSTEDAEK